MSDTVPPESPPPNKLKKKPAPKPADGAVSPRGKHSDPKLRDKDKQIERTPVERTPAPRNDADDADSLPTTKGEKADKTDKSDRGERGERGERAEKSEKSEKAEKGKPLADSKSGKGSPKGSSIAGSKLVDSKAGAASDNDAIALAKTPRPKHDKDADADDDADLHKTPRPKDSAADDDSESEDKDVDDAENDADGDDADDADDKNKADGAKISALSPLVDTLPDEDERFHALCAWLSAAAMVLVMVCPLYFIGPLVYWMRFRSRSYFVSFHAKQALWWSIAATVVLSGLGLTSALLFSGWFGREFAGLNLFALVPVQVPIILWFAWVGLKALHGVKYKTPVFGNKAEANPQTLM